MDDLAQLIAWRAKLLNLRMGGVREITDAGGDRVRFGSDAELARAIASVEAAILRAGRATPHTIRFHTSKGL